ncbi:putative sporulation protein YtxC [Bacillus sp. S/N-304-OC-R1]|uniref:putative sporulation protein YtxC n=1 Tax=Bacillus sp. S/N-304-OC-R1 TaxID=2758034 RepID=UPI001C8E38F7|nr:putative sporulation protein YtxC [Bacillus sp. S/N-304-OC-R1]MBY0124040.1 putative sporulation protein YtxC [Bacillus sp. S/N-304-OC-R1]
MIEITFHKTEDAKNLFKYFQLYLASSALSKNNILHIEDQHIVRIHIQPDMKKHFEPIKEVFYKFITSKQDDWFRKIMAEQYYFEDEEEQQQILEIIHSILEGNRKDLVVFLNDLDMEANLKNAIQEIFRENISFSFDSFVKFRMRPLMDQMVKYVEISIDEYKMEQEYQMFIQMLRDFITGKDPKFKKIHLLIDDGIHFYDENFFEIKRGDLSRMIDRKLLINHPVYVDSVTIAPLLSIAPEIIYLYTDDKEQRLVRTIQNIFEERLTVSSISEFFHHKHVRSLTADEKI